MKKIQGVKLMRNQDHQNHARQELLQKEIRTAYWEMNHHVPDTEEIEWWEENLEEDVYV
jgi:hypothetical protein